METIAPGTVLTCPDETTRVVCTLINIEPAFEGDEYDVWSGASFIVVGPDPNDADELIVDKSGELHRTLGFDAKDFVVMSS